MGRYIHLVRRRGGMTIGQDRFVGCHGGLSSRRGKDRDICMIQLVVDAVFARVCVWGVGIALLP